MSDSAGYALQGFVVAMLRADAPLHALLFRDLPAVEMLDLRIYQEDVWLPDTPVRETLPRVVVGYIEHPWEVEQEAADVMGTGRVDVTVTCLVEQYQRDLGDAIQVRTRDILVSTPISGATIIGARLVPQSPRRPVREVAFRDAWRLQQEFRSAHVGVLA